MKFGESPDKAEAQGNPSGSEVVNTNMVVANALAIISPKKRGERPAIELDDHALVEACQRGESQAMELLYHRYKRRVFGLVTRIVGVSDSEEVVQEVFVRIYRGLGKFRGDAQLSTWIYRLAVNAALSHVSKRKRRPQCEEWEDQAAAETAPMRDSALGQRLEDALQLLPAGYRAVLVLHDVEGLSHEQCAEILGCRIGTSKSQLHKARGRMRELLNESLSEKSEGAPPPSSESAPKRRFFRRSR